MENDLALIKVGLIFLVLIGLAVIELVRLRLDNKRKDAANKPKPES